MGQDTELTEAVIQNVEHFAISAGLKSQKRIKHLN